MAAGDVGPGQFGRPGQQFPPAAPSGSPPGPLAPVHRLAAGTPYVVVTAAAGVTPTPITVSVTTATAAGDTLVVFAGSNTTANGAPVVAGITDTKGNHYTYITSFSSGTATTTGQPCAAWQCANGVPLTTSDSITVSFAGARAIGQNLTVIGIPTPGPLDQATIAQRGNNTSLSVTSGATAWPGEVAIAMINNGNGGGAPTSISGWTQLQQVHGGTSLFTTVAYLSLPALQTATAALTTGVSANLSIILLTFPGAAAADPSQFDQSRQVPPGFFRSPAGTPRLAPPGEATVAPVPPPPPPPLTPSPFPAVPGLAWPGQLSPGSPGSPGGIPPPSGVPYLIGTAADAAGSATTVVTSIVATAAGNGIVVAAMAPSAVVTGVTDSAGNTYTLATSDPSGNEPTWVYVALAAHPLAMAGTVTVAWSSTAGAKNVLAVGCPGVVFSAGVDRVAHADGTSTAPSVTTGILAIAQETAITVISNASAGGAVTWAAGWAGLGVAHSAGNRWTAVAWQNTTATTAVTGSGTLGTSAAWTAVAVTLKLATVPTVASQKTKTTTNDYGLSGVEISTAEGSALLVFAGWDLAQVTSAPMPRVDVSDSAGNYWVHLGTSSNASTASRSSVWLCTNAMAVDWVSVSLSSYASTLAYVVAELPGMPSLVEEDFEVTTFSTAASTLTLSSTTTAADIAFAVLHAGSGAAGLSAGPSGWTAFDTPQVGSADGGSALFPYWLASVPGASPVGASWSITGGDAPLSGVMVAVKQTPTPPVQVNTNFPVTKVEIGFGYEPGDPSQPPPAWTDITARAIAKDGDTWAQWEYGRQYELATQEAGSLTIGVANYDGALTPGNAASPYFPNVTLLAPVRYSAYWDGRWYHVAAGYVERWPQEWPDLPQWGLSKMVATDATSIMASTDMPSALAGEILLDAPYAFLPCGEQYLTFFNGIGGSSGTLTHVTTAEAQGLPAANFSRTNQTSGFYTDGSNAPLETGQALNLVGDTGTGIGASGAVNSQTRGPGMVYNDPLMPGPASTAGCSVEFWFIKNDVNDLTIFSAYGPPSPYNLGNFSVGVTNAGTALVVTTDSGLFTSTTMALSASAQQVVLTFVPTTSSTHPVDLYLYLGGKLKLIAPMIPRDITPWSAVILGCARYQQGIAPSVSDYTAGDLVLYAYPLDGTRIAAHYGTGINGATGATLGQRTAQILSWGYLGLPRGGLLNRGESLGDIFQGPAYGIAGASAAEGVNTAVQGDGGIVLAMPSGVLTVLSRWRLYNLPSTVTFGDSVTPAAEVPFEAGQAFDYDNSYLYNVTTSTQSLGATQGIVVTQKDFDSQKEYFTRSALSQTTATDSFYDAYDQASWALSRYSQPAIRVRAMSVNAAKTPSSFTAVLKTRATSVATTVRRPVGGAVISEVVQVQRVSGSAGPGTWKVDYQLSPYMPDNAVLTLDTAAVNVLGGNADPR